MAVTREMLAVKKQRKKKTPGVQEIKWHDSKKRRSRAKKTKKKWRVKRSGEQEVFVRSSWREAEEIAG